MRYVLLSREYNYDQFIIRVKPWLFLGYFCHYSGYSPLTIIAVNSKKGRFWGYIKMAIYINLFLSTIVNNFLAARRAASSHVKHVTNNCVYLPYAQRSTFVSGVSLGKFRKNNFLSNNGIVQMASVCHSAGMIKIIYPLVQIIYI